MSDHSEFSSLVGRTDEQIDLAAAALWIAAIHEPVDRPDRYLRRLDDFAAWLRLRVDNNLDPERAINQLSHYLATEQGFQGNRQYYDDPRNSCLNHLLERRLGIPITLSVLYLEVGWRLGLPLRGVGLPGHFLVKYVDEEREIFFDPFNGGQIVTREDCEQRLAEIYGRMVPLEEHYLGAVTRKQILIRMLTNLKHLYQRSLDYGRLLETIEHLLAISPWALDEIRDRGMANWQLGRINQAVADFETYLRFCSDANDAGLVQRRLDGIRRRQFP